MNINLKLESCIANNCKKIKFTDSTGLYNATTNVGGWSNSLVPGNLTLNDVIGCRVVLFSLPAPSTQYTFYIKLVGGVNLFPAEATPEFSFTEFDWQGEDGIYNLIYDATTTLPDTITSFNDTIIVTCKAQNCINDLWIKYTMTENKVDLDRALQAEVLLKGAISLFYCDKVKNAADVLKKLKKVCLIASTDCGC